MGDQALLSLGRFAVVLGAGDGRAGLEEGLEVLRHETGADRCELYLLDSTGLELLLLGLVSRRPRHKGPDRLPVDEGLEGLCHKLREACWADNAPAGLDIDREDLVEAEFSTALAVPLLQDGEALGVFELSWRREIWADARRQISRFLAAVVPLLAAHVASGGQCGLHELIHACRNGKPALKSIGQVFKEVSGADIATIHLLSPEDGRVVDRDSSCSSFLSCHRLDAGRLEDCPRETRTGRCTDLRGQRRRWHRNCRSLSQEFSRVLEIPLVQEGGVLGVIFLGWNQPVSGPPFAEAARVSALSKAVSRLVSPRRLEQVSISVGSSCSKEERRLEVRVLGGMSVFVEGRLVASKAFGRAKSLELLALLALRRGRRVSREYLVETLWPEADLESGLSRLHVTVHALRKVVEPSGDERGWHHVREEGGSFWLAMENARLDLAVFEELRFLARRKSADGSPLPECLALADEALELCLGELLGDRLEWEWADPARVDFADQLQDAFGIAVACAVKMDRVDLAISYLRLAVKEQPYREDFRKELVRILVESDRVCEADRVLGAWQELLESEGTVLRMDV